MLFQLALFLAAMQQTYLKPAIRTQDPSNSIHLLLLYRCNGAQSAAEAQDQVMCRALFAAGQLVSKLSSSFKGQQLVDGVLEAVRYIMQGVELAATNSRCDEAGIGSSTLQQQRLMHDAAHTIDGIQCEVEPYGSLQGLILQPDTTNMSHATQMPSAAGGLTPVCRVELVWLN